MDRTSRCVLLGSPVSPFRILDCFDRAEKTVQELVLFRVAHVSSLRAWTSQVAIRPVANRWVKRSPCRAASAWAVVRRRVVRRQSPKKTGQPAAL
jgi:hypothetical protein